MTMIDSTAMMRRLAQEVGESNSDSENSSRGLVTKTFLNSSRDLNGSSCSDSEQQQPHHPSSPSESLEEDIGFAVPSSLPEGTTSDAGSVKRMDRPCHNLELALRGRTHTHETQNVTSSDSEEEEDVTTTYNLSSHQSSQERMKSEQQEASTETLSPELMGLFQLAPIQKGENGSNNTSPAPPVPPPITTLSITPTVRDPVPQRRPPSFLVAPPNPTASGSDSTSGSSSSPLEGNRKRVGSKESAFSRYLPKVEGSARQVMGVNSSSLSIMWGESSSLEFQGFPDDKFHGTFEYDDGDDVSSVDTASLIQSVSQPNMSVIAAASSAWQHFKKSGIERTGTDSLSSEFDDEDGIFITTDATTNMAHSKSSASRKCGNCSCDGVFSWLLPSWYKHAPSHIKVVVVASVLMIFMVLAVFIFGSILLLLEKQQADSGATAHGSLTIADEPKYDQAWEDWQQKQKTKGVSDNGGTRVLRSLIHLP